MNSPRHSVSQAQVFDNVSASNSRYLHFLRDIHDFSRQCETKTYVWGGLGLDVIEGHFLREHHDLDVFSRCLLSVLPEMQACFEQHLATW